MDREWTGNGPLSILLSILMSLLFRVSQMYNFKAYWAGRMHPPLRGNGTYLKISVKYVVKSLRAAASFFCTWGPRAYDRPSF
jgi:hypothetical protein